MPNINLDEELWRRTKIRAAQTNQTATALVTEALGNYLGNMKFTVDATIRPLPDAGGPIEEAVPVTKTGFVRPFNTTGFNPVPKKRK